ncbi:MAG: hypothetical protein Q8876_01615 [Bacillota bacterium]|nr:hypothetical protein [Bacillota bacterium]
MLTVLPLKDEKKLNKIIELLPKVGQAPNVLMAEQDGNDLGYIAISEEKNALNILDIYLVDCENFDELSYEKKSNVDLLIRSAGSYSMNRKLLNLQCENKNLFSLLNRFGFQENQNKTAIPLYELFKPCHI